MMLPPENTKNTTPKKLSIKYTEIDSFFQVSGEFVSKC